MSNYFIQQAALPDLSCKTWQTVDIQITNGFVSAIGSHLTPVSGSTHIPAKGMCVTAGWIDAHAHVYTGNDAVGLERDTFLPDAISTDLHQGSRDIVGSLANTMSKLMACNLDFITVLRLVTVDAARMLQISDKATDIREGTPADLTLFRLEKGTFHFRDSDGNEITGTSRIKPCCTILNQTLYSHYQ